MKKTGFSKETSDRKRTRNRDSYVNNQKYSESAENNSADDRKDKKTHTEDNGMPRHSLPFLKILSAKELREACPELARQFFPGEEPQIRFCKAERFGDSLAGTFAIPHSEDPSLKKITFGYCLRQEELLFFDGNSHVRALLDEMCSQLSPEITSGLLFFFHFMEYLMKDDLVHLIQYEEKLTHLEDMLLEGKTTEYSHRILNTRRDLSALANYYEQLGDLADTLQQYADENEKKDEASFFGRYAARVRRLYSTVQTLKEYSMQLQEMHQTQIDVRQNEIMKFLTSVTTIFMPLNLLAAWYGMNFSYMPELRFPYAYPILSMFCILLLVAELLIFHRKKWLF